jgi:hypothetical protein
MTRRLPTAGFALCVLLAGCGGGDEGSIPAREAQGLTTQLDLVADRMDQDPPLCGSARTQLDQLSQKVAALPSSVEQDVRDELDEGLANLDDLVTRECEQARSEEPTTETTPTITETTETTEPTTTEEEKPKEEKKDKEEETETTDTAPDGEPAPGNGGTPAPEGE